MKRIIIIGILAISMLCVACGGNTPADEQIKSIAKATEVTEQQAAEIQNVLNKCGFDKFKYQLRHYPAKDNALKAGEKFFLIIIEEEFTGTNLLLAPNGTVYKITGANQDIYANNAVQKDIHDVIFYPDEKEKIKNNIKATLNAHFIKLGLKSDKQAEYFGPYDWFFIKDTPLSSARSYVVVTNNAGDKRRWDFKAVFDTSTKEIKNIDVNDKLGDKIPEQRESKLYKILK